MKTLIKNFLVVALLLSGGSTFAESEGVSGDLASDQEVADLLRDLHSRNPRDLTSALSLVEDPRYHVLEIAQGLMALYTREMERVFRQASQRPNTYVLDGLFIAMKALIAENTITEFKSITTDFESRKRAFIGKLANEEHFDEVDESLTELNEALESGEEAQLATLPSSSAANDAQSIPVVSVQKDSPANIPVTAVDDSYEVADDERSVADKILTMPVDPEKGYSPGEIVLQGSVRIIRDDRMQERRDGEFMPVLARDEEAKQTLGVLARLKGMNPALVGPAGSGKTAIAEHLDDLFYEATVESNKALDQLRGTLIIETTPAQIGMMAKSNDDNSQAAAVEMYLGAILETQDFLNRPLAIYIDEAHQLSNGQVEALKRFMDSRKGPRLIFSSTSEEFTMRFKDNRAFMRRVKLIPVEELKVEEIFSVLKSTWIPKVREKFGVEIPDTILERIIEESDKVMPENGKIDGSIKLIQDLAIQYATTHDDEEDFRVGKAEMSVFMRQYYALPVDPQDPVAFLQFMNQVKEDANEIVVGQPRLVNDVLDVYAGLLRNKRKNVATVYANGTSGIGKTLLTESLAKLVLSNRNAVFEINGNEYQNGGYDLNTLFGAPNGVISSDQTSGKFIEWLDDPARGGRGGFLILNEIDKMHSDGGKRIMEMLDRGVITGGDGKVRHLKNTLVLVTSNRNARMIFPPSWESWTEREMEAHIASLDSESIKEKMTFNTSGSSEDGSKMLTELMGRIDLFTVAVPLSKESSRKITENLSEALTAELKDDYGMSFEVDPAVLDLLTDVGHNAEYGARPLVRIVTKAIQDLSSAYLTSPDLVIDAENPESVAIRLDSATNEFVISSGDLEVRMKSPVPENLDPMSDPEFVTEILEFEDKMNELIFGQTEMVERISQAIVAHIGDAENNDRALSIAIVGSTGTGKSETGKAIATVRYGSRERIAFINLGTVRFEGDLNRVFNAPPGYVSGKEPGEFENGLIDNPEGGVFLFDEASNMGGGNPIEKAALFKQLYQILDEPFWTSSATGRTYDLRKYIFIFTGNEGEALFSGLGSDDLRVATWNLNKSRAKVNKMLQEGDVPEAFLGRLADAILQKPLTRDIVGNQIAPKFLEPLFAQARAWGVELAMAEDFATHFGMTFFTQDEGARSVRKVADSHLRTLFVRTRGKLVQQEVDMSDMVLTLSLSDNLPGTVFIQDAASFERNVELKVTAVSRATGEEVLVEAMRVTDFAEKVVLFTEEQATLTAFHEIGHAMANDETYTNMRLEYISLQAREGYLGYARYLPLPSPEGFTLDSLRYTLAMSLAGSAAQQLAGFPADSGMSQDLKQSRNVARDAVLNSGLFPEFNGALGSKVEVNAPLPEQLNEAVANVTNQIFKQAWNLAVDILVEGWGPANAAVRKLLTEGEISGDTFRSVIENDPASQDPLVLLTEENVEKTRAFIEGSHYKLEEPIQCILD